jgi:hypothetical protein
MRRAMAFASALAIAGATTFVSTAPATSAPYGCSQFNSYGSGQSAGAMRLAACLFAFFHTE